MPVHSITNLENMTRGASVLDDKEVMGDILVEASTQLAGGLLESEEVEQCTRVITASSQWIARRIVGELISVSPILSRRQT